MDSVVGVQASKDLKDQLQKLWGLAGMHARKMLSNSVEVMKSQKLIV